MLTPSRFNYLIELSQKVIVAVDSMLQAYRGFPALIEEEHVMIKAHTYTDRLEQIAAEKFELSESIERGFEDLQQLSHQIYLIWGETDCEGQAAYPGDLSNSIKMLDGIAEKLRGSGSSLAMGVLDLQINRVKEAVASFKSEMVKIKPLIELNRIALTEITKNYQASTRVLIEMCEQAQATYTPQGQQSRPSTGTSTIFVKA